MEKYGWAGHVTDNNTIQCVRFAWRVNKATETLRNFNVHSFSTPTKVSECASIIRYTYIGCLVYVCRNIQCLFMEFVWISASAPIILLMIRTGLLLFSLLHRKWCRVTQSLHQPLHIYKIYKIYTLKHWKHSDMFRSYPLDA